MNGKPSQHFCILCGRLYSPQAEDTGLCPACAPSIAQSSLSVSKRSQRSTLLNDGSTTWQEGQTLLETYEVKGVLGEGGMGTVYRVHHNAWNIDLALKQPKPDVVAQAGVESFVNEAQAWVDLGLHPHIATCHYVRKIDELPCVFAELVEGGSLADWIKKGKLRKLEDMLDVAIQFAWGLHYAHELGMIHQDVKPANVLMKEDGVTKVTDFGLVKAGAKGRTISSGKGTMLAEWSGGTQAYFSPEQSAWVNLAGQAQQWADAGEKELSDKLLEQMEILPKPTRRTDLWSWGLCVLEMFNGKRGWAYGSAALESLETYLDRGPAVAGVPAMPPAVGDLLLACFQEGPNQRPHDLQEAAQRLIEVYRKLTGRDYARQQPKAVDLRADSLNNKALSMLDLEKRTEALALVNDALAIDPVHPEAVYNQALLQWRSGEIDDIEVLHRLEKVQGATADRWPAAYLLGLVHMQRGDFASAKQVLHGLEVHPEAQDILAQVNGFMPGSRLVSTLEGHESWLHCAAFSPDGRQALSSSMDQTLRLWDLESGKCLKTFIVPNGNVVKAAFSLDGRKIISANEHADLTWWDLSTGQRSQVYEGYVKKVRSIDFTRDASIILICQGDGSIHLRDTVTGDRLTVFMRVEDGLLSGSIRWDGLYVITGNWDGSLRVWDIKARKFFKAYEGHEERAFSVAFNQDGLLALSGGFDKTVKLWDVKTGECKHIMRGHTNSVKCVTFSPDGRFALSGGYDAMMRLWDVSTGVCLRTFEGHQSCVNDVSFSPDGRSVLTAADKSPRLWQLDGIGKFDAPFCLTMPFSGGEAIEFEEKSSDKINQAQDSIKKRDYGRALRLAREVRSLPEYERDDSVMQIWFELYSHCRLDHFRGGWQSSMLKGHENVVNAVAFHPDGRHVLSGSRDKTLRLWAVETGECIKIFKGHEKGINCVDIRQDGRRVVSGSSDNTLRVWDLKTGACLQIFEEHDKGVECVAFSPNGRFVLSGGLFDNSLCLLDLAKERCIRRLRGHTSSVISVDISPNGRFALSGSMDETLRLWDLESGECLRVFKGNPWKVSSVAFSPDGTLALSCSNLSVMLWEVETGKCLKTLEGHTDWVNAVAFSPDGRCALSGQGSDFEHGHTIKLWDLDSGECLQTFEGHQKAVKSLDFSPNGAFVVSGSDDLTVCLWALDWDLVKNL